MAATKENQVVSLIQREYQEKHTMSQAFLTICQELKDDYLADITIDQCHDFLSIIEDSRLVLN